MQTCTCTCRLYSVCEESRVNPSSATIEGDSVIDYTFSNNNQKGKVALQN